MAKVAQQVPVSLVATAVLARKDRQLGRRDEVAHSTRQFGCHTASRAPVAAAMEDQGGPEGPEVLEGAAAREAT